MHVARPGTLEARVRDELREMARSGQIEIGLSYHLFFEVVKKATDSAYREDRLQKCRLLTELCGRNAFPYPTELGKGKRFSKDGLWVPDEDLDEIDIDRVVNLMIRGIADVPAVNRHDRRALSKHFKNSAASNPAAFVQAAQRVWPLKFGHELVLNGDLARHLTGKIAHSDINNKLRFYITDPEMAYHVWFELYERDDPIAERRQNLANTFESMRQELISHLGDAANLLTDVRETLIGTGDDALNPENRASLVKLRTGIKAHCKAMTSPPELYEQSPRWREYFGDDSALVAAQILYAFHREKRAVAPSDTMDFVHAMYLPHTDLWRGDKGFSDLLIKHKVNFSERIVSRLADLPARIAAAMMDIAC